MTFGSRRLSSASAAGACGLARARPLARPDASSTCLHPHDVDARSAAADRLVKADRNLLLQILTTFRIPPFSAVDMSENVAEVQIAGSTEIETLKTETPACLCFAGFE